MQTVVKTTYTVVRTGEADTIRDAARPIEDRAFWLPQREGRAERAPPPWERDKKRKKKKHP